MSEHAPIASEAYVGSLEAVSAWVIEFAPQGVRRIVLRAPCGECALTAAQANELRIKLDEAISRYDDPTALPPPEPKASMHEAPSAKQDVLDLLDDIE